MKITLVGHASILVEMNGATCLMDPVFGDPFEDGAVVTCPKRKVYPERLPPVDVLIISHRHPDHFDLSSLSMLQRDCITICPADPLIVYALEKLGFRDIQPVHAMGEIRSDTMELFPTQSEVTSVREFGMVFHDSSGTFWNQVDTELSAATIEAVVQRFGQIDLLFAMYASQNFDFFENRTTAFPYEIHAANLANVVRIRPRVVVPGSAGFRFCDDQEWLNAFLFPISRERFAGDMRQLDPSIDVRIVNPGDMIELQKEAVDLLPAASKVAEMEMDDTARIRFDPTRPIPPLVDLNPRGDSTVRLKELTEEFVVKGLSGFINDGYKSGHPLITQYLEIQAQYAVEIVYPDDAADCYRFDFGVNPPRLVTGAGAMEHANIVHRIAASALVEWIERRKSYFYVRAFSRRFSTLNRLRMEDGTVNLEPVLVPDLLMHYLLNESEGSEFAAKHYVDLKLQAL
ncbi:MAG: MBL fold metallo-hydrolase [Candidatus Poribacteria bacterium]|nr:MBL fold metallo-hydrolase [Candidatus Poribacteria bacterium]